MPSDSRTSRDCPKTKSDSCPMGHEMMPCATGDGYYCKQCSEISYQPDESWLGDRCRLRRNCLARANMIYLDPGSTTKDANCGCQNGYHFVNEDQRACVPNIECVKGYGQGEYGTCVRCINKMMYSDVKDRHSKCKPLTNCEKQNRCTVKKSNGTTDNVCGPLVKDLKTCEARDDSSSGDSNGTTTYAIAGTVCGVLFLIVIICIILIYFRRRREYRRRNREQPMTQDQLKELKVKIVKECDRDTPLCKKVLSKTYSVVESRIDRQIWTLAQELFRSHPKPGHYESIVNKYKDSQHKYAVNGYLQEWRMWRGENKEAVVEMFRCLGCANRDDITYEVCIALRDDVDYIPDRTGKNDYSSKLSFQDECVEIMFPCLCKKQSEKSSGVLMKDAGEANTKLLEMSPTDSDVGPATAGKIYRERPYPSAPVIEEPNGLPLDEGVRYNRQYSQPVQATS